MIIKKSKEGKDYTDKFMNDYKINDNDLNCVILEMDWEKEYILCFHKAKNFQEFIVWNLLDYAGDKTIGCKSTVTGKYFGDLLAAVKYYRKMIK